MDNISLSQQNLINENIQPQAIQQNEKNISDPTIQNAQISLNDIFEFENNNDIVNEENYIDSFETSSKNPKTDDIQQENFIDKFIMQSEEPQIQAFDEQEKTANEIDYSNLQDVISDDKETATIDEQEKTANEIDYSNLQDLISDDKESVKIDEQEKAANEIDYSNLQDLISDDKESVKIDEQEKAANEVDYSNLQDLISDDKETATIDEQENMLFDEIYKEADKQIENYLKDENVSNVQSKTLQKHEAINPEIKKPDSNANKVQIPISTNQPQFTKIGNSGSATYQNQVIAIPHTPMPQQQGASGVNIVIYNPSVIPGNASIANSYCSYPMQAYPSNYYVQKPQTPKVSAPANTINEISDKTNETEDQNNYNNFQSEDSDAKQIKDLNNESATETKKYTQLTDDYVRTLENFLRSDNAEIRVSGMKKLMELLQEDPSRSDDIALNNLVNLALQDKNHKVRFLALCTIENHWATGDDLTYQILNNMQNSSEIYGQDALFAANLLLDMAANKVEVEEPVTTLDTQTPTMMGQDWGAYGI